ncbi:MAG TPA: DUF951 domain-containing protein [Anaerolineae bacterium]|nr:DUF951 domain-containing protein [Anaerolineae bacterium]HQK14175.1 DUF951 domain-containing protein [Anaerolineae bacterium]
MVGKAPLFLQVGDVVEMRKAHPCGGRTWRIMRVGADIGIECLTCHRYVLVPRTRFEARLKRFVERPDTTPSWNT